MYFDDGSRHGTDPWDPSSAAEGGPTPKWEIAKQQQEQQQMEQQQMEQEMIQRILTGYDAQAASQLSRDESEFERYRRRACPLNTF